MRKKVFDIKNLCGRGIGHSRPLKLEKQLNQHLPANLDPGFIACQRVHVLLENRQSNQCAIHNFDACRVPGSISTGKS